MRYAYKLIIILFNKSNSMLKKLFFLAIIIGLAGMVYYISEQPKNSVVQASFGANALALYKSDGTTLLGKLLSVPSGSTCENFVYFDSSGNVKKMSYDDCSGKKVSSLYSSSTIQNIYFTTVDCSGSAYVSTTTFASISAQTDNYKYVFSLASSSYIAFRAIKTAPPTGVLSLKAYKKYLNGACVSTVLSKTMISVSSISTSTSLGNLCNGDCKIKDTP